MEAKPYQLTTVTIAHACTVFAIEHFRDGKWVKLSAELKCTSGEKIKVDPLVAECLFNSGNATRKGGKPAAADSEDPHEGSDALATEVPTEPPQVTNPEDAATIAGNTGGRMIALKDVTDELRALWVKKDHPKYLTLQPNQLQANPRLVGEDDFDDLPDNLRNRCYVVLTPDYCAVLPNKKALGSIVGKV